MMGGVFILRPTSDCKSILYSWSLVALEHNRSPGMEDHQHNKPSFIARYSHFKTTLSKVFLG